MMKSRKTALYCRVSTEMQAEKGESIEHQKTTLKEYAKENGLKAGLYEDSGFSAKDTNRPAMTRLIEDIRKDKIGLVVVTKLDRITRSIKDLIDLLELFEEYNVVFKSLTQPFDTSSAMGRGFLRMMGEFAQIEREMISDRVGESMRFRAKKGIWNCGMVAYGYMVQTQLIRQFVKSGLTKEQAEKKAVKLAPEKKKAYINPAEQEVVKQIFSKYMEMESIRGVAQWLNEKGNKTRQNADWSTVTVSRILQNPTYIGKVCYNKRISSKSSGKLKVRPPEEWIVAEGQHEPIIDNETFGRVQNLLNKQKKRPRRKASDYLLSGLVRCGICGGAVCGVSQRMKRNGKQVSYSYYKCHTPSTKGTNKCSIVSVRKEVLEDIVIEKVLALVDSQDYQIQIQEALDEFNKQTRNQERPLAKEKSKLEKRAIQIKDKKKSLLEHLEDNTIDKTTYKDRIRELNAENERLSKRLDEVEVAINDINVEALSFDAVYDSLKNFRSRWKHLDFAGKKDFLYQLISEVILNKDEVELHLFFLPPVSTASGNNGAGHRRLKQGKKPSSSSRFGNVHIRLCLY